MPGSAPISPGTHNNGTAPAIRTNPSNPARRDPSGAITCIAVNAVASSRPGANRSRTSAFDPSSKDNRCSQSIRDSRPASRRHIGHSPSIRTIRRGNIATGSLYGEAGPGGTSSEPSMNAMIAHVTED